MRAFLFLLYYKHNSELKFELVNLFLHFVITNPAVENSFCAVAN